jgi:hypothetical protein
MRSLAVLLAPAAVALCGCGSAHRRAAEKDTAAVVLQREKVLAEASDLTQWTTCPGWLTVSRAARERYLRRHWPNLSDTQARAATRDQSLGCEASPGAAGSAMSTLQDAVYISILNFSGIYEELVEEGMKKNTEAFTIGLLGGLKLQAPPPTPPRPRPLRHRHRASTPKG